MVVQSRTFLAVEKYKKDDTKPNIKEETGRYVQNIADSYSDYRHLPPIEICDLHEIGFRFEEDH